MIVDGLNVLYGIDRFATDPVNTMIKVRLGVALRRTLTPNLDTFRRSTFSRTSACLARRCYSSRASTPCLASRPRFKRTYAPCANSSWSTTRKVQSLTFGRERCLRSCCSSRDDWFVLYAALHSKAYVLTSDILRKERGFANKSSPAKNAQVNDTLQKWLYRYQYMFIRQGKRAFFKVTPRPPLGSWKRC